MSVLSSITKPVDRPVIMTVLGEAGLGKTSLAATFPKPIFIRAEDGLQAIPEANRPDAFPMADTVEALMEQLGALVHEEHDYKTLVIDSVTQLETMFIQYVIDNDPKKPKSINQAMGGYGSGMAAVSALHGRVRKAAKMLNDKGMHIVFIAHADTETIELPDQDPYMRYALRLGKKSMSHYVDNVDLVGLVKLQMFLKGDDDKRKKAISTGQRVITATTSASSVTKNRYGITQDLPCELGVNPFVNHIPSLTEK